MEIVALTEQKENKFLEDLYNNFENGFAFEKFLKLYLEEIGFDEIEVTRRTRDGGVDLVAVRNGIDDFSSVDKINYYIQAKRYKTRKIGVNLIRELKGVIPFGHKGMLITISFFTNDAIFESDNDISKPVVLVDGKTLLNSCIRHHIGFAFEPKFSSELFKEFNNRGVSCISENLSSNNLEIEKQITYNDIRAKIISVPSKIANLLNDREDYLIKFENDEFMSKFIEGRKYFSKGFSNVYKKYKLINKDGIIISKKALWKFNDNIITINLI